MYLVSKYHKGLIFSSLWKRFSLSCIKSLIKTHISTTLLQDELEQQNVTQLFHFQTKSFWKDDKTERRKCCHGEVSNFSSLSNWIVISNFHLNWIYLNLDSAEEIWTEVFTAWLWYPHCSSSAVDAYRGCEVHRIIHVIGVYLHSEGLNMCRYTKTLMWGLQKGEKQKLQHLVFSSKLACNIPLCLKGKL